MAALIGVLAIRKRGIYFAMVTLALSQCVYYLFYQAVDWTGGENGLRGFERGVPKPGCFAIPAIPASSSMTM